MTFKQVSILCLLSSAAIASGCASLGVKPWQRDLLAGEGMRLDANPLDTAIDDVKNVVDGNPLGADAKQELSRDLADLRDLRERFDRGELRDFH